jgi:quercetin dioxygenase-like cupin family protein
MNRFLALVSSLAMASAFAQSQTISRAGSQPSTAGPAANFTGTVRVDPLFPARDGGPSGGSVTFEPGARSAWHTHPAGQTLIVTAGEGRTQSWGGPMEVIRAGDVVNCPPGVKHWHGAAPNSRMTHIAITYFRDGKNVEWMEHVSDAQYGMAPAAAPIPAPAPTGAIALRKLAALVAFPVASLASSAEGTDPMKIRLTIDGKSITATLNDNATAKDFVSLLPLTLALEDYAATEKIARPPRKLSTAGAPPGADPSVGDIAYYAPWGNIAMYYKDFEYTPGLVLHGRIDSGVDVLRGKGARSVTIEGVK